VARVTRRDAIIVLEAMLLAAVMVRQHARQPWRSRGRRLS
jgi:hypothetical protein